MKPDKKPVSLRRHLRWFAEAMERKLSLNDHKGGWDDEEPREMLEASWNEMAEVSDALARWTEKPTYENAMAVLAETADAANYLLFVADLVRMSNDIPLVVPEDLGT
ncbi:MAG: hypothetical protein KGJ23_08735 [Euryarchaeota archaeon]|nr:hypothetical protein [Euryarchaeota archaeon]MDE1836689.1 hypothetical protein [Euryarchaeota archaeon]MDE1880282.1 hypothetical protein [Euryarchaeota archaeon]MDE2044659.1 hypothetical protein [Thermoplasmata archaeon]